MAASISLPSISLPSAPAASSGGTPVQNKPAVPVGEQTPAQRAAAFAAAGLTPTQQAMVISGKSYAATSTPAKTAGTGMQSPGTPGGYFPGTGPGVGAIPGMPEQYSMDAGVPQQGAETDLSSGQPGAVNPGDPYANGRNQRTSAAQGGAQVPGMQAQQGGAVRTQGVNAAPTKVDVTKTSPGYEDRVLASDVNGFPLFNMAPKVSGSILPTVTGTGAQPFDQSAQATFETKKVLTQTSVYDSPEFLSAKARVIEKQQELDRIDESIEGVRSDIVSETQGRASQSYIDAMVTDRSTKLMKSKRQATRDYNAAVAELKYMKESADSQQQASKDNFDAQMKILNFQLDQQYKANGYQLDLVKTIGTLTGTLPQGMTVEVGGYKVTGQGNSSDFQLFNITDTSGRVSIVQVDKRSGAMKKMSTGIVERVPGTGANEQPRRVISTQEAKSLIPQNIAEGMAEELEQTRGWWNSTPDMDSFYSKNQFVLSKEKGVTSVIALPYGDTSKSVERIIK